MRSRSIIWLMVLGLIPGIVTAQIDSSSTEVQKQLEEAFEEFDEENAELSGEQLIQFLEDLATDPVNINRAGLDELLIIPGMDLIKAEAIITYRKNKPFERISELMKVSGIGNVTYQRMQPYVTIGSSATKFRDMYTKTGYWKSNVKFEYINRYQQNIEEQEGYARADSNGGYLGSPVKYYQRFKLTTNHLSLNLTQEKDAGEMLSSPSDFDFNSWHIALLKNGVLKKFVVGDYNLSFGQGLVLWSGGAFGKGREVIGTVSRNGRGLRPYSSAQETDYFKGVAATFGKDLEMTVFYSNRDRTASIIEGDTVRFPSSSGFHRTENETGRKNNLNQLTYGYRVQAYTKYGIFGQSGYLNSFSKYVGKGNGVADLYDFSGTDNSVFGMDYRASIQRNIVFGELARSENGGVGALAGLQSTIGERTDISLMYRNYSKDYQSYFGDGFGERSSSPQNEEGFYLGIRNRLNTIFTVSGYFDQYSFPSPVTGTTQATKGSDMLTLIEAVFSKKASAYLLIRNEQKEDEFDKIDLSGREETILGEEIRSSVRAHLEYQLNRDVRIRSRVEFVKYRPAGGTYESGFLMYQDLRYQLFRKLRLDTRITLFDTDSFNTRVYQFENDLLYVMSNVALSDQGQRAYFLLKYEPLDYLDIWFKYSVSVYEDAQFLSSGLNEIKGNRRSFVGIQARLYLR